MNPRIHCLKAVMTINSLPAAQLINQIENQMSRSPNWQKTDAMEELYIAFRLPVENVYPREENQF